MTMASSASRRPRRSAAADRLRELLHARLGDDWNAGLLAKLLAQAGKSDDAGGLAARRILRAALQALPPPPVHLAHLGRPQATAFSALVNYHKLDRKPTLEKLTYTYLGDWITPPAGRRRSAARPAADARLPAAEQLQERLEADPRRRAALRHLRPLEAARTSSPSAGTPTSTTACA